MQDGIIKGTGNSWNLKSVPNFLTLYPTYEAFVQGLIDGTLPVDLNGMNPTGWQQMGTILSKANLLKDATAALFGFNAAAVPDEVLAKAGAMIGTVNGNVAGKAWFAQGSYVGVGGTKTLNASFDPKCFIIVSGLMMSVGIRDSDVVPLYSGPRSTANTYANVSEIEGVVWGSKSVTIPSALTSPTVSYKYILLG